MLGVGGPLELIVEEAPRAPALDTALSRAILLEVAAGRRAPTLRLARPAAMVAFGRIDAVAPGYPAAVRAARAGGFEAVERLAGGRAAVFHEGTIAFAWAAPSIDARREVQERFRLVAEAVREALAGLGLDARVGEVPGEYCPGAWSVSARGQVKLMGVGQRLVPGAAHAGGVIVVHAGARVREVLEPVYAALGIEWDPATAGAIEDELAGVTWRAVADAVAAAFGRRFALRAGVLGEETLAAAERMAGDHRSPDFAAGAAAA